MTTISQKSTVKEHQLEEVITRNAVLQPVYSSFAAAFFELVDNPIDRRHGNKLTIKCLYNRDKDEAIVFDYGGQGMGLDEIDGWLKWGVGSGEKHAAGHIGQYNLGGKKATIFLGKGIEVIFRKKGEAKTFYFSDPEWGIREEPVVPKVLEYNSVGDLFETIGKPIPTVISQGNIPSVFLGDMTGNPLLRQGFTYIRIYKLKKMMVNKVNLSNKIAETYRPLIEKGHVEISFNGDPVNPTKIPESTTIKSIEIEEQVFTGEPGEPPLIVSGRIFARTGNDKSLSISPGIRTYFNNRRITEGEDFGTNLSLTGSYQRLYGELHISSFLPVVEKDGWNVDSPQWHKLHEFMKKQMQIMLEELRSRGKEKPLSIAQKKIIREVESEIRKVLEGMFGDSLNGLDLMLTSFPESVNGGTHEGPGGRKPATPGESVRPTNGNNTKGSRVVKHRTPPPSNPVGKLLRNLHRTSLGFIDCVDLGRGPRSIWRIKDNNPDEKTIVINTGFPMYKELNGEKSYIKDTAFQHILSDIAKTTDEFREQVDEAIWFLSNDEGVTDG